MPVVLLRLDERLIHGQVVAGWGGHLHPDRIVVVDDDLASSDWEQELYTIGLPEAVRAEFVDVDRARQLLPVWRSDRLRTILLVRDVAGLRRLLEGRTGEGMEVNLGGVHHAEGRRHALPYIFLSESELEHLRRMADEEGVDISARDVPTAAKVPLHRLKLR